MTDSSPRRVDGRQGRLALARAFHPRREDFVVSASNAEAVAAVDAWPAWPGGALALIGPEGCGKSHLAVAWVDRVGAAVVGPDETDLAHLEGRPVLIEDADRLPADETLFHLINRTDGGASLLLTGRAPPRAWRTTIPDLRSRLNALVTAKIGPPDDRVLEAVLRRLFDERNIKPADEVIAYLLKRIERSTPSARAAVARIDELAAAEGREITRRLARQILEDSWETRQAHD